MRMAKEGARVFGCDVNEDALTAARATFAEQAVDVELTNADVTSQDDVDRLVATAGDRVDILANVAGIMDFFLPLGDVDDATWEQVPSRPRSAPPQLPACRGRWSEPSSPWRP
jgi:NAD(P)-dependent dehydrogenase (short-subunit alcohol dehydrogenase family)